MVRAGVPRFVVRVPAQRPTRRRTARAHRTCRLPVRVAPPRRPLRRGVVGRSPAAGHPDPRPRLPVPRARPAAARPRLHRARAHDVGRRARPRRTDRRHPHRDLDHRRSGRRLGARRQRRRVSPRRPERLPDHRPRGVGRPRPGRPAPAAVQRGDLVPDGVRARRASMRALVDAKVESQFSRAMRYVESVGARAVVPSAGPPCFLDPRAVPPQRDHRRRAEHLRRPTGVPRAARRRPARRVVGDPRHGDRRPPRGDHRVPPGRRRRGRRRSSSARRVPRPYQADWIGWIDDAAGDVGRRRPQRPRRRAEGAVEPLLAMCPTVREGIGRRCCAPRRRRRRRDPRRLPRRRGPRLRRRALRVPLRHRPPARREGRRRGRRRLEQLAVPVVPLPGVARGRVQRVRLQLPEVTLARPDAAHRGRGAPQAAPADRDRARHRARRLGGAATVPAPQRRPRRVRRGRGVRADLHHARMAIRPRDR